MPFFSFSQQDLDEYEAALAGAPREFNQRGLPLAVRPMVYAINMERKEPSPGRRLRVFAGLITKDNGGVHLRGDWYPGNRLLIEAGVTNTYGEAYAFCAADERAREALSAIPLRMSFTGHPAPNLRFDSVPEGYVWHRDERDAELPVGLQDIGWWLAKELTDACEAFSNPDIFYPGIDEGIEHVYDEHVALVIWGAQRELDRELRRGKSSAPLSELPWRIQRAYAERRRYIYQCYGIGREQYEANAWSLWDVPEEPDWVPPWVQA